MPHQREDGLAALARDTVARAQILRVYQRFCGTPASGRGRGAVFVLAASDGVAIQQSRPVKTNTMGLTLSRCRMGEAR